MTKKSWAFSDLVAAILAALHETFVRSKYVVIFIKILFDNRRRFRRSSVIFFACEMSPGWGHLITWMDPSVGHLNGILPRVGGNLNNNFQKRQMPGGACWSFDLTDTLYGDNTLVPFSLWLLIKIVDKIDGNTTEQYRKPWASLCATKCSMQTGSRQAEKWTRFTSNVVKSSQNYT